VTGLPFDLAFGVVGVVGVSAFGVWRLAFGVWRLAFGVWRLAFGVWRLAFGVMAFGVVGIIGVVGNADSGEAATQDSLGRSPRNWSPQRPRTESALQSSP
jgi:hypothetical protein